MASSARLDVWARAEICTLSRCGHTAAAISQTVRKKDGTRPRLRCVQAVLQKKKKEPRWRGDDSRAGGRPKTLPEETQQALVQFLVTKRGTMRVTAAVCKRFVPSARKVSNKTVVRTLKAAGLAHLPRRKKRSVPKEWREKRVQFCNWILSRRASFLKRFAYSDGTTFYLARGAAEQGDKKRAALGPKVWRMSDGKDGLWDENVGPSCYAKSQGQPVKLWGFLANGKLHIHVLAPDGARTTHMNAGRYERLVSEKFSEWRQDCFGDGGRIHLIQDHEKCLWKAPCIEAMKRSKCLVVETYPKHSPDLNAIEGIWRCLKERLEATAPSRLETRASFLRRLRGAVRWLNDNRHDDFLSLCNNQKTRAQAVLGLDGAKCSY